MKKLFSFSSIIFLFILSIQLFLVSCDNNSVPKITKEIDRTNTPITLTVSVYGSRQKLQKAWRKHAKKHNLDEDLIVLGFAFWDAEEPYRCDIHVKDIKQLNDIEMETWGHELAHCVYGTYHEGNE